ncbi:MAG: rhamnogalacturonan acetylesterase [Mangrovibacterium sp.]
MNKNFLLVLCLLVCLFVTSAVKAQEKFKFDFGSGKLEKGYLAVHANTEYSSDRGYGLIPYGPIQDVESTQKGKLNSDYVLSNGAFYFKLDVPEGRYRVTVTLGSEDVATQTTVKAESRRLFVHNLQLEAGEQRQLTFIVDVFSTHIEGDERGVGLKEREKTTLNWDNSLSLEFNGECVALAALEIEKVNVPVIYIAGDSTVTDQNSEPWASWGQMFPFFLKPDCAVANYAVSGSTLRHYRSSRRLEKALSLMKLGDYMIVEFAHNDQKQKAYEPYGEYQEDIKDYCDKIIEKGGQPILITSTQRRNFNEDGKVINTLGDFPQAMRDYAKEHGIALVDLNKMSMELYEALGEENSKKALVHYPMGSFPGQTKVFADNTHFNTYGAYELAKCIVQSIINQDLSLKKHVKDDFANFDPNYPDNPDDFIWPLSPSLDFEKPYGN